MKDQEPSIPTCLYKMVAFMEVAIFNCQCDQMHNCEGGCETITTIVASFMTRLRIKIIPASSADFRLQSLRLELVIGSCGCYTSVNSRRWTNVTASGICQRTGSLADKIRYGIVQQNAHSYGK